MPKKNNIIFICENCGETAINWMGKCPSCNSWNTLKPFTEPEENKINVKNINKNSNSIGDKALLTSIKKIKSILFYWRRIFGANKIKSG